jgi:hypothetical protein
MDKKKPKKIRVKDQEDMFKYAYVYSHTTSRRSGCWGSRGIALAWHDNGDADRNDVLDSQCMKV